MLAHFGNSLTTIGQFTHQTNFLFLYPIAHVTNAGPRGYKPGVPRHLSADADRESQYSGHSSSQTVPLPGPAGSKLNRFDQHRVGVGRVRRSTSNANAAAMGGVRREINQRKTKLPGNF